MSGWKPKNLDEALNDAIGSALNDNARMEDAPNAPPYLLYKDFDNVIKQAIQNIKKVKEITIKYRKR